jgi:NAD(P)-dependent dehydrogenase (short-subunit alcohol dehydrogenase family)
MARVVVVTGASRGIGRSTALRLASRGFDVFATVRSADDAHRLEDDSAGSVRAVCLDLTDDASIRQAVDRLTGSGFGALHGLVNVAAAQGRAVPLEAVTRADLDEQFAVTGAGTMVLTAAMVPLLRVGRGRVVNVGGGALSMPLLGAGFAAKHALEAMSDVLRVELAADGIRVIVVEPGMTRWEDVEAQRAAYDDALDEGVAAVRESERARYRRAADAFKRINRRMLDRGALAADVAATIERALTTRRPRARYHCGAAQHFAAVLSRVAPTSLKDRVLRRLVRL